MPAALACTQLTFPSYLETSTPRTVAPDAQVRSGVDCWQALSVEADEQPRAPAADARLVETRIPMPAATDLTLGRLLPWDSTSRPITQGARTPSTASRFDDVRRQRREHTNGV